MRNSLMIIFILGIQYFVLKNALPGPILSLDAKAAPDSGLLTSYGEILRSVAREVGEGPAQPFTHRTCPAQESFLTWGGLTIIQLS
jgi:hypothetical protein